MHRFPKLDDSDPRAPTLMAAQAELTVGSDAMDQGNEGKARVCGRRAVGAYIQGTIALREEAFGTHAMANLRGVMNDDAAPTQIQAAARRLLGGPRSIASGEEHSTDPISDAVAIILHYLDRTD